MTHTHAAFQLLRHGPLDLGQIQEITGWEYRTCTTALIALRQSGRIRILRRGAKTDRFRSVYSVADPKSELLETA